MKQQLDKAIAAHGAWKERLEGAIETGEIDIPVETIKVDDQCEFGKWLYGEGAEVAADHADRYAKVKELHAQFHAAAGHVAELATGGKADEAKEALGGNYHSASSQLTEEMTAWSGEV
jgi:hypothetical protein